MVDEEKIIKRASPSNRSVFSNSYFELPNQDEHNINFGNFFNENRRYLGITNASNEHNIEDLYKVINVQQNTINKLTLELTKKSQTIPRNVYEKALNDLEIEKYEHSKTKLNLVETNNKLNACLDDIEFFKNELEKERSAYRNVFELLKDKALTESSKSIDLISKIAETEIRYNDAVNDIFQKEKKYSELCNKIKQKEKNYEDKMLELNLNLEQDKYINQILSQPNTNTKRKANK